MRKTILNLKGGKNRSFYDKKLFFLKNNRYCDKIRMVYEDILCMGLSTQNVDKVSKIVLEKLEGIECDQLPNSTFSKYMLIEA